MADTKQPAIQAVEADATKAADTVVETAVADVKKVLTEAEQLAAKVERGVQNWISTHLRNTAFSQDTGAWNVLQKALQHLASAIVEEVK
jgi:hypothetical protein